MKTTAVRRLAIAVGIFGVALGLSGRVGADIVVSVSIDNKGIGGYFGRLDLTTGQFTEQFALAKFVGALTTDAGGTLYAATVDGHINTVGPGGVFTQFGSGIATPNPSGGANFGYYGLAVTSSGFLGVNLNQQAFNGPTLNTISADGNMVSTLVGPIKSYEFNAGGALSYGPDGSLYMIARPTAFGFLNGPELMRVDPATGAATAIGNGLGTFFEHDLALVTVGNQLYGIDAVIDLTAPPHVGIYTINTTTGLATSTGVKLTGLPFGYRIDGVVNTLVVNAVPVPEPPSIAMVLLGALAIGGAGRARCRPGAI